MWNWENTNSLRKGENMSDIEEQRRQQNLTGLARQYFSFSADPRQ